ncbi:hypothetical protein [Melioribacter sp. OK-6-Me]|uniref:hypothetical protein n=1 Tax=unclassified Melioribacter TaxID=2627329 RepID=UPI003EDAA1A3
MSDYVIKQLNNLLNTWIKSEDGTGVYKYVGGYWELLLPLFKKYTPEGIKMYQNLICEEFSL